MADQWTWYRAAIAAKNEGKPLPQIKTDQPECGVFWRKASKAGGRIPVLINLDGNGELYARCGTRESHRLEDASRIWSWCAENIVDRDSYKHAWETGTWPDGTPTTAVDDGPGHAVALKDASGSRERSSMRHSKVSTSRLITSSESRNRLALWTSTQLRPPILRRETKAPVPSPTWRTLSACRSAIHGSRSRLT